MEGIEISGGEKQKIVLARALYRDAPMVILDEPTSALDPVAEQDIYTRFNSMVSEKTAVFIVGLNGAGKTTFIKLILRLCIYTSNIHLAGRRCKGYGKNKRKRIPAFQEN